MLFDFKSDFERIEGDLTELFWKAAVLYVLKGDDERYSFKDGIIYFVAPDDGKLYPILDRERVRENVREFFDTIFKVQAESGMVFDGVVEVAKSFLEEETSKLEKYEKAGLL